MTPRQLIRFYKTQTAAAAALGLTQPAIANMLKRGKISGFQQLRIERVSNGQLKAAKNILSTPRTVSQA